MSAEEQLTRWTVRAALALYVAALALRITARGRRRWQAAARLAWTAGFALLVVHVACAFHFYHGWSHEAAYEATARDTAAVVGLDWGGGIFANYAFVLLWGADACCWWQWRRRYESRARLVDWSIQGYLGFIAFNATVIFETGVLRWAGVAACALLAGLAAWRWKARDKA